MGSAQTATNPCSRTGIGPATTRPPWAVTRSLTGSIPAHWKYGSHAGGALWSRIGPTPPTRAPPNAVNRLYPPACGSSTASQSQPRSEP